MTLPKVCLYCQKPFHGTGDYCCNGCKTIDRFLKANHLEKLNQPRFSPDALLLQLDSETYLRKIHPENPWEQTFFIEGIHCASCVFLIEQLPHLVQNIEKSRLNLGQNTLTISLKERGSFKEVVECLYRMGYPAHLIDSSEALSQKQAQENRSWLMRIGVAAACAGNIMMVSIPLYKQAYGTYASLFLTTAALLTIPVITYCAWPFYRAAFSSLKFRHLSIDLPIALALLLGGCLSLWNQFRGSSFVYYDSLSMLVFLLLSSRYFLKRIQEKMSTKLAIIPFLEVAVAQKKTTAGWQKVASCELCEGDTILIEPTHFIPCDGTILSGKSEINTASLTGETALQPVDVGDFVFAGTTNQSYPIEVQVTAIGSKTRIGKLWHQVETTQKPQLLQLSDLVSNWLLVGISILGLGLMIFFFTQSHVLEGLNRLLSLLIITCPCALAVANPLCFGLAIQHAASKGILIKHSAAIEHCWQIQHIAFDKTGTLTQGLLEITQCTVLYPHKNLFSYVLTLESESKHPIAKALIRYVQTTYPKSQQIPLLHITETPGQGLSGYDGENHIFIGKPPKDFPFQVNAETTIVMTINHTPHLYFQLEDQLRPETTDIVQALSSRYNLIILSGDQPQTTRYFANQAGIATALGDLSPEQKVDWIHDHPHTLMIGDGANDAFALKAADLGIAVQGSLDLSLKAADVYFIDPGLKPLPYLMLLSQKVKKTLSLNILFALLFNCFGIGLSLAGHMSPLLAAILMPCSSLIVLSNTLLRTKP